MARQRSDSVPRDPTEAEQRYRELLETLACSGLTQREFSRRHRVPAGSLAWWRHEIARRDRVRAGWTAGSAGPALLPVRIVGAKESLPCAQEGERAGGAFDVRLARSGHEIRISTAFDPRQLALLVKTLEVTSC